MLYLEMKTMTISFYFKVFSTEYSKYINYFIKIHEIKSLDTKKKVCF